MAFTPVATTDTLETFRTRYNATNITVVDDSSTTVDITLATDSLKLSGGTGIASAISGDTVTFNLSNTGVSAATYGSSTAIPVIAVNAQGQITSASTASVSSDLTIVDDSSTSETITLGSETLKFAGGDGIATAITSGTVTISKSGGVAYRQAFVFTATADQTTFSGADDASNTLAYQASNRDVFLNGVLLAEADYTASNGTSVVLGAGAAANDVLTVFNYETTSLSLADMNGTELVLDVDGDTSLHADTDDQIDVRIGGADDFAFKANKFEVQTGSNIDMNGTELILDADGDTSITADTDDQIDIRVSGADDFQIVANNFKVLSGSTLTIESGATVTNNGTANGFASGAAADDISTGDAAVTIATSAGNITLDAQGNDTDIIFKGTDGSSDTTFLTIDGSEAGLLLPNNGIDLNGKELILDADADTSITADTDDQVDIKIGGTDRLSIASTGAVSTVSTAAGATLTLQSTHADALGSGLILYHNSSSPADNDILAEVIGRGRNDNSQDVDYSHIKTTAIDVSDGTEDATMGFFTMKAGTSTEQLRIEQDGDLHADGDVIAFSTTVSDVALKSDIKVIPNALDKLDKIKGYTFTRHNGTTSAGIIAQELEKVLPEAVKDKTLALVDGKTYKTVQYDAIHGLLIQAIKELKEEIRELKS